MTSLFVPHKGGFYDVEEYKIQKAVQEYDERLTLALNENTGDWCIYYRRSREDPFFPVLGLGNTLPDKDAVLRRIYNADTVRHGQKMLEQINKKNDKLQRQNDQEIDAITEYLADAVASYETQSKPTFIKETPNRRTDNHNGN